MSEWGLLPNEVYNLIRKREWDNHRNLQKRLTGERTFPISIPLKPPSDQQVLSDITRFQNFISDWQEFIFSDFVDWDSRNYRSLKQQNIPKRLVIPSMQSLFDYLGKDAVARGHLWEQRMEPLLNMNKDLYSVLIKHLLTIEAVSQLEIELIVKLLPQMFKGMGEGKYLRALPLKGVDTKFVESFTPLITDLLDVMHQGNVMQAGGLLAWLQCLGNPSGWITVRPLCPIVQAKIGGFSILQLPIAELRRMSLPADNILVVENIQSGLGLTNVKNTIAVFGGGRNVSWMNADWLNEKNVGYWGDIDTWGLAILSDARTLAHNTIPIMMDENTVLQFKDRMVDEPEKHMGLPSNLNKAEKTLFSDLKSNKFGAGRLEQERLSADYINKYIDVWLCENN